MLIRFLPILILTSMMPTLVLANGCIDAPNRIYRDVKKYAGTLSERKFSWENINWLQVQLGMPKVKKLPNNQIEYSWQCAEDADVTLLVITDVAGRFIYVKGQYNLDSGSGIFEADINQKAVPSPIEKKVAITPSKPLAAPPSSQIEPSKLTTAAQNPAVCENLVQQISDDVKKYSLGNNNQTNDLPWMKLNWLQLKLGPTSSTQAQEILSTWNNFQLLQQATATSQSYGQQDKPLNYSTAVQLFGEPNNKQTETYTKYVWRCSPNTNSILEIYADKDNRLGYVTGSTCSQGRCTDFSVQLQPSDLRSAITMPEIKTSASRASSPQVTTAQPSTTQTPAQSLPLTAASITDYNQHFQTQFTNAADVQQDMIKRMKTYYTGLQNCTPGDYQLAVNVSGQAVFASAIIKGKQNDFCMIQEGTQIGTQRIIKLCNYGTATLKFFTDPEAEAIASGNTNFSSRNLTELQRAELTQCKIYINGVPV